jgi:hypothetical protein
MIMIIMMMSRVVSLTMVIITIIMTMVMMTLTRSMLLPPLGGAGGLGAHGRGEHRGP